MNIKKIWLNFFVLSSVVILLKYFLLSRTIKPKICTTNFIFPCGLELLLWLFFGFVYFILTYTTILFIAEKIAEKISIFPNNKKLEKSYKKTFKIIILVVAILMFIHFIFNYILLLNQKSAHEIRTKVNKSTVKNLDMPKLKFDKNLVENLSNYVIPEFQITLKINKQLADELVYYYRKDIDTIYFSTKTFVNGDPACSSRYGPLGALSKNGLSESNKVVEFEDFSLYFSGPHEPCSFVGNEVNSELYDLAMKNSGGSYQLGSWNDKTNKYDFVEIVKTRKKP